MTKSKAKRKRKPRRVVLGVGHPWFYAPTLVAGRKQQIAMFLTPAHQVFTDLKPIDPVDLGNWNKIRLVAEVLE